MSIRTNLHPNPDPQSGSGWLPYAGSGGVATTTYPSTGGPTNLGYGRMTWTTAATGQDGNWSSGQGGNATRAPVTGGATYTASAYVRVNASHPLVLITHWWDSAGGFLTSDVATVTTPALNTWTRLSMTSTAPPTAAYAYVEVRRQSATGSFAAGNTFDVGGSMVEAGATLGGYFSGATPDTAGLDYAWTGTPNASTSTESTVSPVSITATPDPTNGRVALLIHPTSTGTVYVYRRDPGFVATVRQAIEGVPVVAGVDVTLYDYEPPQGISTDYLLSNAAGSILATTNLTVPQWGTWLKSPLRPWLNVMCALGKVGDVTRGASREVVWIEGAANATVLSEVRRGPGGQLTLSVRTPAQLAALTELLNSGDTLMLDATPDWALPYRYINVGDTVEARLWDELGLDKPFRTLVLQGVLNANPPMGPLALTAVGTYADIPTTFATYAAIPLTVGSYADLASAVL